MLRRVIKVAFFSHAWCGTSKKFIRRRPLHGETAKVTIDFAARAINLPVPENFTALKHWYDQVSKRPSALA
jgi:hypothetical protein